MEEKCLSKGMLKTHPIAINFYVHITIPSFNDLENKDGKLKILKTSIFSFSQCFIHFQEHISLFEQSLSSVKAFRF